MPKIGIAVRVLREIALLGAGAALLGVQAEGARSMFKAKPFRILKRINQEGNNETN